MGEIAVEMVRNVQIQDVSGSRANSCFLTDWIRQGRERGAKDIFKILNLGNSKDGVAISWDGEACEGEQASSLGLVPWRCLLDIQVEMSVG